MVRPAYAVDVTDTVAWGSVVVVKRVLVVVCCGKVVVT